MLTYRVIAFLLFSGVLLDLSNSKYKKALFNFNISCFFLIVSFKYGIRKYYFQYELLFDEALSLSDIKSLSYFLRNEQI